ncbi:hypothetical protein [Undibacterium flavidum]|uniref:Uncharacterized protein n=1 Tax=Undibacterium flavidum TaxID=2762297 RepID=A0ABR6YHA7_9BURK|nr:hypothetical protein [Undibacterium flavidum]MBC3875975.1 hypothetical protein [Undibacterium flavidum]
MQVLEILALGAAISKVDQAGCEQLLKNIAKSISLNGRPKAEDSAELNSVALLSVWANHVRTINTVKGRKTPDFKAVIGEIAVECEVTNSEPKSHQLELQNRSHDLTQRLQVVLTAPGLRVRFTDDANESDFCEMISAVVGLKPGETRESYGLWFIQAYETPIQADPDAGNPVWWPKQYAQPATFHFSFQVAHQSANQQVTSQSTIEVNWSLSTRSYINSLSKKENAEQASSTMPFILLCDVTHLPGAFGWYNDNFPPILKAWSQKISAVVLFCRGITGLDSLQFEYQIHTNPNAQIAAPEELTIQTKGKMTIPFNSPRQTSSNAC